MTRIDFLHALKAFTEGAVKGLIMPVRVQRTDEEQSYREAAVFVQRIPDTASITKKTPYIMHQLLTGIDSQREGSAASSSVMVRTVFCIYNSDENEGPLMLMNLMERLRIAILKKGSVSDRYRIDLAQGIETLQYSDDTAPYYAGEMITHWILPCIQKEDGVWL